MRWRSRGAIYASFFALTLLAYAWRLPRGVSYGDETYYANFQVAWLRSPIAETGDLSVHQPSHLLVFPLVRLYALAVPDLTGLILFLRVVYAAACLGIAAVILAALRDTPRLVAFALALTPICFIPFGLPAPSYNSLGLLFSLCSGCCLLRLHNAPASDPATVWVWLAGLFGSLQTFSYPSLAPVILGVAIASWLLSRGEPELARRLRKSLIALLLGHAIVTGIVVGVFGIDRLLAILEFSRAYGVNFSLEKKLALAASQLRENPDFLLLGGIGFVASLLRTLFAKRTFARFLHAMVIGGVLTTVILPDRTIPEFRGHGVVLVLALIGLTTGRHLFSVTASPRDRFLALWFCGGLFGGFLTSWTSNNALLNFAVGGFGLVPPLLFDWFRDETGEPRADFSRLLAAVCVLAALTFPSMTYFYGDTRDGSKFVRVKGGPFAGLRTTPARVRELDAIRRAVAAAGSSRESVTVLGIFPGLFLLGDMKSLTPHSWPLTPEYPGLTPILERHYADRKNLPEVFLWYLPPLGAHPVQREVLIRDYALLNDDRKLLVFRRRDLVKGEAGRALVEWGRGFSVEEMEEGGYWRWAAAEAELRVVHFGARPRRYRLRAMAHTYSPGPALLKIVGPDRIETIPVDQALHSLNFTFTLPPGESTVRFSCDAVPLVNPSRTLVFALRDYRVEPIEE